MNIKTFKTIFILSLSVALFGCNANRIILIGPSHHFNAGDRNYNNDNYGVGLESNHNGLVLYYNSQYRTTFAAYHKFRTTDYSHLFLGAATGYNDNLSLFVGNVFKFKGIRLLTSFPVGKLTGKTDVINLQYEWEF